MRVLLIISAYEINNNPYCPWTYVFIMTQSIDFNNLKARTMGSGSDEEAVTVNTRALIDKVLSRYSGEWLVKIVL